MLNKEDDDLDLFIVEFSLYYNLKQEACITLLYTWISYFVEKEHNLSHHSSFDRSSFIINEAQ